jgi:acyl-CoA thioesterase-2
MTQTPLEQAIHASLDALLASFTLEVVGEDRFRGSNEPSRFARLFGGQLLGQALLAASATVADKLPHSLHAYFVAGGSPDAPIDIGVERVRDGRSVATRRVTLTQETRTLLTVIASFHANSTAPEVGTAPPDVPPPDALPRLQDWINDLPQDLREGNRNWIDVPPPLELRIGEAPTFMGGDRAEDDRPHWMRLPRPVGDDPALHAAILAYASDYLLLDMVFRSHPDDVSRSSATSLDHSLWIHRPVRIDRWHVYTQRTIGIVGHRGLVQGTIHDEDGRLVATVMQECLARLDP